MTKNRAMGMILDPIKNRANSKSVLWEAVLWEALLYKLSKPKNSMQTETPQVT